MPDQALPTGPQPEAITASILERYPDTDVVEIPGAIFFSIDAEKHWPNFATIVTTDDFDEGAPSDLSARPGVFRLNIGLGKESFERHVGSVVDPDVAVLDRDPALQRTGTLRCR